MTSHSSDTVRRAAYAPRWGTFFLMAAPLFFLYGSWLAAMSDSEHGSIGAYAMGQYRATDGANSELREYWLETARKLDARDGPQAVVEPSSFNRSVAQL